MKFFNGWRVLVDRKKKTNISISNELNEKAEAEEWQRYQIDRKSRKRNHQETMELPKQVQVSIEE